MNAQNEIASLSPCELRTRFRDGSLDVTTSGLAYGYVQANLVALPAEFAFDFLLFCQRNPKPCPLVEVLEAGRTEPATAPGADLRTDLPRYRIWRNGELVDEVSDINSLWREDMVSFLIGCSFSFEAALVASKIPVRHIERGCNVPMYRTNRPCAAAGRFGGPLVVSMRPIPGPLVAAAVEISAQMPHAHGAPVHIGDPTALGIRSLDEPDYGDPVRLNHGDVPVFWACGVTPQAVAVATRVPFTITHSPGRMFITDRENDRYMMGAAQTATTASR
jgi:uncharacterized protein YcsI (UPF0317 family)